ncbi:NAD(P)/FAD-dependent oxidoreductase [Nocardioides bruguierae]|uniref:NAD(P)/FAD-dependent oxidoreductase n=1 Tax=Nocardioides bruguierae TaxID=2945102 RepID=UPI002020DFAB|nr:FAD-dependent oxidoreductase [Nocardioides bruguierae]MCL8025945.1 FAD-dependent oxidoreductase [Nocardioides bruguierae]
MEPRDAADDLTPPPEGARDGAPARVLVVGAGVAGLATARALHREGLQVRVVDRGRRVGGRLASRTWDGRPVDHGASYLTVSEEGAREGFDQVVAAWEVAGLARRWTDTFGVAEAASRRTTTGPVRWAAPGGLRGLAEDLARHLDVHLDVTVERVDAGPDGRPVVDGETWDGVVLAMPDTQARRLLGPGLRDAGTALDGESEPIMAVAARWPQRCWSDLPDGLFVNDHPVLSWVADDGRRRGDDAPVLVAHSTPGLARDHLDDPGAALGPVLEALTELLGVPAPEDAWVHRWGLARPVDGHDAAYWLHPVAHGAVAACGDGWSRKPRVEAAWLSGERCAAAVGARLRDVRDQGLSGQGPRSRPA